MSERSEARDRRVWRLAYLLTGDGAAAARVLGRVDAARGNVPADDPARLDRLIITHARDAVRERPRRGAPGPARPGTPSPEALECWQAALAMPEQPREAWVLTRLDGLDGLRMSRAMDCSRTAAERHLAAADEAMRARLGDRLEGVLAALREYADGLDAGPPVEAHRREQRRRRRIRLAAAAIAAAVVVLGAVVIVLRVNA